MKTIISLIVLLSVPAMAIDNCVNNTRTACINERCAGDQVDNICHTQKDYQSQFMSCNAIAEYSCGLEDDAQSLATTTQPENIQEEGGLARWEREIAREMAEGYCLWQGAVKNGAEFAMCVEMHSQFCPLTNDNCI